MTQRESSYMHQLQVKKNQRRIKLILSQLQKMELPKMNIPNKVKFGTFHIDLGKDELVLSVSVNMCMDDAWVTTALVKNKRVISDENFGYDFVHKFYNFDELVDEVTRVHDLL